MRSRSPRGYTAFMPAVADSGPLATTHAMGDRDVKPARWMALAIALLGCATLAQAAKRHVAPPAGLPAWMELVVHRATPEEVANIYQSLYLAHCAAPVSGGDPEAQATARGSTEIRFHDNCAHVDVFDGPFAGGWDFKAPDGADDPRPGIARRIVFATGSRPYRATITVYCDQASDTCRRYTSDTMHMRPPDPGTFAGRASIQSRGWWEAVGNEPCVAGPLLRQPPDYPREALANGITGTVILRLLTNRCGEVRDVVIERSSNDRSLDRAAVAAAWRWRVQVPPAPDPRKHFHWMRAPVDFNL